MHVHKADVDGVQVYFVERVRRVSEKLFFPVICWSVSLVRFTLAVVMSAVVSTTTLHDFEIRWEWLVTANWVTSAFMDTMITVLLFYTLARKRRVAFKGSVYARTGPDPYLTQN